MAGVGRVAVTGCALLALAACGRDAGAAAEPAPSSTTALTSSTSVVTSTTGAPTTTLSPAQEDDADIRALHDRFYRMLDVTADPPNPNHPEIAATTTGIERQRWEEWTQQMLDGGERSVGDVHGRILEVQRVEDGHASVRSCIFAQTTRTAADGSVVGGDDGYPTVTELRLTRTPGGWRVEDWYTGGTERCDA
jgi:hypothetical protein